MPKFMPVLLFSLSTNGLKLQEIVKNGFDSLNRTLLSIADILQNQGTGVAASVGGTAPLSGTGALIVDAISQSSHVDGLATCSVSVLGAEGKKHE